MVRLADEMKKKASDPTKITRSKIWIAGHTHADGRPVRPEFEQTIEQIKSLDSEMGSTSNISYREDAVSKVLGKDKSGRVRGLGRGITATKLAFIQARDAHVQKLEAKQAELVTEIEDLKHLVQDIAKGKKKQADDHPQSDDTGTSNLGPRCQILDWYSEDDVVVGEGELCSVEPTYKIGRIPLGPNAAAVLVNFVADKEAYVWRPTTAINSLGQAVGAKIAWPFDKIILDSMNSQSLNKSVGSSATNALEARIKVIDWNNDDEVIAEGYLISTEPKEMVNNIMLGPNAAVLKIDKVINKNAYLWRPSEHMNVMGDALFENIAWPISKVQECNVQQRGEGVYTKASGSKEESLSKGTGSSVNKGVVPSKDSSPKSAANSSNTSGSSKKKCFLLDCFGSGQKVAEGKVLSSNPKDNCHCVPLGPNASKVWVEVSKIDDAPVWRPNSEFQIIADALGSTIAWPNDKIVYI